MTENYSVNKDTKLLFFDIDLLFGSCIVCSSNDNYRKFININIIIFSYLDKLKK